MGEVKKMAAAFDLTASCCILVCPSAYAYYVEKRKIPERVIRIEF